MLRYRKAKMAYLTSEAHFTLIHVLCPLFRVFSFFLFPFNGIFCIYRWIPEVLMPCGTVKRLSALFYSEVIMVIFLCSHDEVKLARSMSALTRKKLPDLSCFISCQYVHCFQESFLFWINLSSIQIVFGLSGS